MPIVGCWSIPQWRKRHVQAHPCSLPTAPNCHKETARRAVSFAKEAGARITAFFAKPEYPVSYYGEGALIDPTTPEKFAELAEQQAQQTLDFVVRVVRGAGVRSTSCR
jgi:nucleotide-binding universal stress UspA family protein